MLCFFIGFLFIFLDFPVSFGASQINFIPDFIGYALILFTCKRFLKENGHFLPVGIASFLLFLWSVAAFVMDAAAFKMNVWVGMIADILVTLCALYLTYEFTEGMKEYESSIGKPLGASALASAWILLCMGNLIYYFSLFFESLTLMCLLLQLLSLVWFEYSVFVIYKNIRKLKR